jgi:hypothetical protein
MITRIFWKVCRGLLSDPQRVSYTKKCTTKVALFLFYKGKGKQALLYLYKIEKPDFVGRISLAEKGGFEPPVPFPVRQFSKLLV